MKEKILDQLNRIITRPSIREYLKKLPLPLIISVGELIDIINFSSLFLIFLKKDMCKELLSSQVMVII